ncbi:hypothetical protein BASA61_006394 [Batrachochytrium salamandrivorans]|nr:hypothetical protein BASA61_006394 [Batrachochytrium salamandrivorans]KAH9272688.1 hypothetical protein BASA83_004890 [Batrachochytrium salamandrivorans]KAJ1340916.1 hypothetical protein BSLG_004389 [Batrachochytrium salamandrivorans]
MASNDQWSCRACTFLNDNSLGLACEICGTIRTPTPHTLGSLSSPTPNPAIAAIDAVSAGSPLSAVDRNPTPKVKIEDRKTSYGIQRGKEACSLQQYSSQASSSSMHAPITTMPQSSSNQNVASSSPIHINRVVRSNSSKGSTSDSTITLDTSLLKRHTEDSSQDAARIGGNSDVEIILHKRPKAEKSNISGIPTQIASSPSWPVQSTLDLSADVKSASHPWYNGRLAMTYIVGCSNQGRIRFQDLIDKDKLKKICVSSYVVDDDWFLSQLPSGIKVCMARPKPREIPDDVHQIPLSNSVLCVFPKMPSYVGAMHTKFMLLWYPRFLRVVITSANLTPYDWQELENVVFYQDFPIKHSKKRQENQNGPLTSTINSPSGFGEHLCTILAAMDIPDTVISSVVKHDFRNSIGVLVGSMPGKHNLEIDQKPRWAASALCDAAASISCLGRINLSDAIVCMQTSSMGSSTSDWINHMYKAFRGYDLTSTTPPTATALALPTSVDASTSLTILFPTQRTVENSRNGIPGAGTIFFPRKLWPSYPKHILRSCQSQNEGVLMHSKISIVHTPTCVQELTRSQQIQIVRLDTTSVHTLNSAMINNNTATAAGSTDNSSLIDGYIYCGSHNATQAAWGIPVRPKTKGVATLGGHGPLSSVHDSVKLQVEVKNWELGVLLPFKVVVRDASNNIIVDKRQVKGMQEPFPLPFIYPPKVYAANDRPFSQY